MRWLVNIIFLREIQINKMLGFVVPIKPKPLSKDWGYENLLLERTIRSICSQQNDKFKVFIVHNEKPQINFSHPNIEYVHYPYPAVTINDIEDFHSYVKQYYNEIYAERMMDKGKKIFYGCKKAIEFHCDFIMAVDSDDLVSNLLAGFVNQVSHSEIAGWRIKNGYIYEEGSRLAIKSKQIFGINGSTHIIRASIIEIPDFNRNIFWNYNLFEAHGYTLARIKEYYGLDLDYIDFPAVIYIVHKNNYSNIKKIISGITLKNILKKILRTKIITYKMRSEFGLIKLSSKKYEA